MNADEAAVARVLLKIERASRDGHAAKLRTLRARIRSIRELSEKWRTWAVDERARSILKTDAYAEAVLTCADELAVALSAPKDE